MYVCVCLLHTIYILRTDTYHCPVLLCEGDVTLCLRMWTPRPDHLGAVWTLGSATHNAYCASVFLICKKEIKIVSTSQNTERVK